MTAASTTIDAPAAARALVSVQKTDAGWPVTGPREFMAGSFRDGKGIYAGWRIDDAGQLTLHHDANGVHPFFYAARRDTLLLSTSVRALLDAGASPALDEAAM